MSSIGKYRRNLATFEETAQYIQIYVFFFAIRALVLSMFQIVSFEPETNLLILNISDLMYINIYHGIFLPIKMKIPVASTSNETFSDFFVHPPRILEPRREQYHDIVSKQSKQFKDVPEDSLPSRYQSYLVLSHSHSHTRSRRADPITTIDI